MLKGLAAGVAVVLGASGAHAEMSSAVRQEAAAVPGLSQPAELIVDRWGIPHIYAKTPRDAFFLQGWNAARDRLWQIDLWRKRGLGRLFPVVGRFRRVRRLFRHAPRSPSRKTVARQAA